MNDDVGRALQATDARLQVRRVRRYRALVPAALREPPQHEDEMTRRVAYRPPELGDTRLTVGEAAQRQRISAEMLAGWTRLDGRFLAGVLAGNMVANAREQARIARALQGCREEMRWPELIRPTPAHPQQRGWGFCLTWCRDADRCAS